MSEFFTGVGSISLRLRHARSLKDKRKVTESLIQRIKNLGGSICEYESQEDPKLARLGFAFVSGQTYLVQKLFDEVERLLWGEFELVAFNKQIHPVTMESFFTENEELEWKYE